MIPEMKTPGDDPLTAIASSRNIIDILGKIDQVGKVITEVRRHYVYQNRVSDPLQVHPYAKLAWSVLNAAQRVSDFLRHFDMLLGRNCSNRT